jgi:hypothetical protein
MPSLRSSRRRGGVDIYLTWIEQDRRAKKRRRPKGEEPGGVPVEPNRPSTLSGGAAAVLEYDD